MAKIQRDQVIEAALALLDEVGLEAITTRKLAQKLGVESATLYWHFKNKASLLEEMASAVLAKHHSLPVPEDIAEWTNWLAENARSFRARFARPSGRRPVTCRDITGPGGRGYVSSQGGVSCPRRFH